MKSVSAPPSTDGRTRDRVRTLLLDLGPSTATTLAERTGLTVAAVRRHLDALVADGIVTTRTPRLREVKRGRPARLYALTEAGHAAGPSAYDDLATSALRFMGTEAVEAFAQTRAADLEARFAAVARSAKDRPAALAEALSADGYAATIHEQGSRHPAVPAPLPGAARRHRVPAALRRRDGRPRAAARRACPTTRDHRPRRRRVHHVHPCCHIYSEGNTVTTTNTDQLEGLGNYKFGWADSDVAGADAKRGINEDVVRDISAKKNEPEWMLDLRLKGLKLFTEEAHADLGC